MKNIYPILFAIIYTTSLNAQDNAAVVSKIPGGKVFQFRIKIQRLQNTVTGTLLGISDSGVSIVADTLPWRTKKIYIQTDSVNVQHIPAAEIEWIQAQRNSFVTGICIGAVAGFGAGYLVGSVAYKNDDSKTTMENDEARKANELITGIIGAVPGSIIGAIAGSISSRKKFKINYRSENLYALERALYKHNNL